MLLAVALGGQLQAAALAPLAVAVRSRALGFLAVAAAHGALAAAPPCLTGGLQRAKGGFDPGSGLHCCAVASATVALGSAALRAFTGAPLEVFTGGLAVFGHGGYLAAVLAMASAWRSNWETYVPRQLLAVLSLLAAFLWGWLFAVPALTCASYTFAVLFILEKELENRWDHRGLKVLAAYALLQHLYNNRQYIASMLDPANLYV